MKQEEFMESIYGCLERIENKINGLSMPQKVQENKAKSIKDKPIQTDKQNK